LVFTYAKDGNRDQVLSFPCMHGVQVGINKAGKGEYKIRFMSFSSSRRPKLFRSIEDSEQKKKEDSAPIARPQTRSVVERGPGIDRLWSRSPRSGQRPGALSARSFHVKITWCA
jgi:hypothetical protein